MSKLRKRTGFKSLTRPKPSAHDAEEWHNLVYHRKDRPYPASSNANLVLGLVVIGIFVFIFAMLAVFLLGPLEDCDHSDIHNAPCPDCGVWIP